VDPTRATDNDPAGVLACIGLGANLGDAAGTLEAALAALGRLPRTVLVARSALYRCAPVDAQGPDFINAVALVRTGLFPLDCLHALQALEAAHHRQRPYRNAPRTLDLDLLLWGDQSLDLPDLQVPHPRMLQRAFVLRPLADLLPELVIPGAGPLRDWLPGLAGQQVELLGPAPSENQRKESTPP
jgi:2-amino-4-hydroxy-6-hydroxymethyldihydropteridine diphosphokinase